MTMKKSNPRSKPNEKKQKQSWFIFIYIPLSHLHSSNTKWNFTNRHTANLPPFLKTAELRTGIILQIFSPEIANGENALQVAEIKAYFSLDSAVCIGKLLIRWKGWKSKKRAYTSLRSYQQKPQNTMLDDSSLLRVAFMWEIAKYLKADKWWTVNDYSNSEEEKKAYVWHWGRCNRMSLTH